MEFRFSFRMSGIGIAVEADDPVLFAIVRDSFAGHGISPGESAHRISVELHLSQATPLNPDESITLLFTYSGITGYTLDGDTLLLSDKKTFMIIDGKKGKATGFVDAATLKRDAAPVSLFVTIALIELLRYHRLYYLHAAAVMGDRHSILLCGMSMTGKTTLALGLSSRGYRLCSDDAVFIKGYSGRLTAVGFKKDIHVAGDTAPRYKHLLRDAKPKRSPSAKTPVSYSGFETVPAVTPDVVFFLDLAKARRTTVTPLTETQAMASIIPQSLMVFFSRTHAQDHMNTLRLLIHQARPYRCLCGSDLLEDPLIALRGIGEQGEKCRSTK